MATVTGLGKNLGKKLAGLERKRSLWKEEHVAACTEFLKRAENGDDQVELARLWKLICEINNKWSGLDDEYIDLVAQNLSEEELREEFKITREVQEMYCRCAAAFEKGAERRTEVPAGMQSKEVYRLPRLEVRVFDGNPNNWLPFWHQFKRIHEDSNIRPGDKLQYLHQFTTGKVRDLVSSYPQVEENYEEILDTVKRRFASDKLLVRYYVKEILKLVIEPKAKLKLDSLYRSLESKLRALHLLGVTKENYCDILLPLVEAALPEEILMLWHRQSGDSEPSEKGGDLASLLTFLGKEVENKCRVQEAGFSPSQCKISSVKTVEKGGSSSAAALVSFPQMKCLFCDKVSHPSGKCRVAEQMSVKERRDIVFKKGACFSCLKVGHRSSQCKSVGKCSKCAKRHVTLLCEADSNEKSSAVSCLTSKDEHCTSYLPTLLVRVEAGRARKTVRALIDSGCQRSYITEELAEDLKLKPVGREDLRNCLFGGVTSYNKVYNRYEVCVRGMNGRFAVRVNVLGEDKICEPLPSVGQEVVKMFPEVTFTDTQRQDRPIALVLGADVFGQIVAGGMTVYRKGLTATKTKLGWVLTGAQRVGSIEPKVFCMQNIASLWEVEAIGIKDPLEKKRENELHEEAVEHFKKHVSRDDKGRYCVALPWVVNHSSLPNNLELAEKRLRSMSRRLCKNKFVDSYQSVLDEWERLEIIEEVPECELENPCHYLPHHPVVRMTKETTKVRPVFDASSAAEGNPSLNDCLNKGPNILESIIPLVIKFRLHKFGLIADIEKAFLQIGVREDDRNFLRFLWWKRGKVNEEMAIYRHKRLVFGVCCSPFLLGATVSLHLSKYEAKDLKEREIIDKLSTSLYVDDCIVSLDTEEELKEFMNVTENVMKDACFNLRGWKFNGQEGNLDTPALVLGLQWELKEDTMGCAFQIREAEKSDSLTKRQLLSIANRLFDPLGFWCPISLVPKLLLQEVWKQGLAWDSELPQELVAKFHSWAKQLPSLEECRLPRWVFREPVDWERCSLHIFCDASQVAYAACVYIRTEDNSGVRVQLLLAKSRVAPLKKSTIPRLELLSACIGVRLAEAVQSSLPVKIPKTFWTDSRVVLAWVKRREPWNTFVKNRVEEIRAKTEAELWRHVPGKSNPADLPSRGCNAAKYLEQKWWEGPRWLEQEQERWPIEEGEADEAIVGSERKRSVCMSMSVTSAESFLDSFTRYFSSFNRIVRMGAWMIRFSFRMKLLNKLRKTGSPKEKKELEIKLAELSGELSSEEMKAAECAVLKLVQAECIDMKDNKFVGFKLFRDELGVIRLRSRLTQGLEDDYVLNPIVLVDHELIRRLIFEQHVILGHAGMSITLAQLRERFFIIKGRQLVKRIVRSCVRCRKLLGKHFTVPEAPLPLERISQVAAFQVTGVDLGGPLFIKKGKKVWFVLFTCAVYRAVHLELVVDLSTDAFMMALRRFLARRGRIKTMFSDQGTNFVGANNLMRRLDGDALQRECNLRRISWRFNPPSAPWWGGWWERLIGLVKVALRKTLGKAYLNYVELETLICDIESVINHRPLTYISDDPNELSALTPAQFIQDLPGGETKDLDEIDSKFLGKRAQYVQSVRSHLRERFRREYLAELVNRRSKKGRMSPGIKVGEIVLVEDHSKRRVNWPLGKVLEVISGRDGEGRTIKVKTATGTLVRPVQRLYPLEIRPEVVEAPAENVVKTKSGRVVRPVSRLNL